jgi:hypothetical protein
MRRRLPRILLNAATGLSAALCVATATLWVRSYYRSDSVTRHRAVPSSGVAGVDWEDHVSVVSDGGRLGYVLRRVGAQGGHRHEYIHPARVASGLPYWTFQASEMPPPGWLGWAREVESARFGPVRWARGRSASPYVFERSRAVGVSHWVFVGLFAPLPLVRWRSYGERARRARLNPRLCRSCGYDLRATPGRCPECGAVPPAPPLPA